MLYVMKRCAAAMTALALLLPTACATTTPASAGTASAIDVRVEQLPDAGFNVEDKGAASIAYQMTIHNGLTAPITLRKVEMRALDRSPYSLRTTPAEMSEVIAPGRESTVTFTMWSYRKAQRSTAKAMVYVSGTAFFAGAQGEMRKEFSQSFREP